MQRSHTVTYQKYSVRLQNRLKNGEEIMKIHSLLVAGLISSFGLIGCVVSPANDNVDTYLAIPIEKQVSNERMQSVATSGAQSMAAKSQSFEKQNLIKITGIGYGAASSFANVSKGQRRLMAIRASKMDAYRSLAEQLYGIKIDSNTAISTLTAKSDSFRARVNAVVRGARVVSVTPMADRNYETVLEVYVDRGFFNNTFIYSDNSQSNRSSNGSCSGMNCH